MSEEYNKLSDSEKKKEDWMNSKWRPMMGWLYMGTCTFDFVIFPILWSLLQAITHASQITQWQPLTLQGAGLYHIAMGAVLGLAAFGRTQEKLAGANNGGAAAQPAAFGVPTSVPSQGPSGFGAATNTAGFGAPAAPAAGGFASSGFGSTPKPATPAMSSSGKPMPLQPDQPEL